MSENNFSSLKNFFLIFFIFKTLIFFSQTEINRSTNQKSISLSHSFSIQKFDNFLLHSIEIDLKRISFYSSIGFGVNRTFFQNRFFPQINIGLGYALIKRQKLSISSNVQSSFFTFKAIDRHYFTSFQLGYCMKYGKKLFLINRAGTGILNEKFKNKMGKTTSASTFHYQFSIGLGYAF
jgi:hypothetical protein